LIHVNAAQAALLTTVDSLAYVYHAQEDPDGTTNGWNHSESYHGYPNADLAFNGSPTYNAATGSAYANLSGAFTFAAADNATQAGSALNTYGSASMTRTGSTNRDSMTWEMWVRPTLDGTPTNSDLDGQYLFGGTSGNNTRGVWLKFKENGPTVDLHLYMERDSGGTGASATWTLDATDANANGLIDILEGEFLQITAMYDKDDAVRSGDDYAYLSVNGAAAVTNSDTTNGGAVQFNGQLGWANFSNNPVGPTAFSTTTKTGFAGDIALLRVYDTALTDAQIAEAYDSVAFTSGGAAGVPEPGTLVLAAIGLLGLASVRRRRVR
jgi:hypothetical protein